MNNIRNLDIKLLVAFIKLYEARNVSRAAEQLSVTQPAVSSMLGRLRYVFDDPLFVRTQHGILPTARADELVSSVREVVANLEKLVAPVEFDPQTACKTITISANDYMQETVLVPFISRMSALAPNLRLSIKPPIMEGLSEGLANGELDIAITAPELTDDKLRRSVLYTERYICIGRANHPLQEGAISLGDFCTLRHLIVSPSRGSFTGPTDVSLKELGASRNVSVSLPSFQTLLKLLQEDDYLALVPQRLIGNSPYKVKRFQLPFQISDFDVIACWHAVNDHDPLLNWCRTQLIQTVSSI